MKYLCFSCILGQKPELGIAKGQYYHSSMLIAGFCNMILPSFGMPFVTASLQHSPQFTRAITKFDKNTELWTILKYTTINQKIWVGRQT